MLVDFACGQARGGKSTKPILILKHVNYVVYNSSQSSQYFIITRSSTRPASIDIKGEEKGDGGGRGQSQFLLGSSHLRVTKSYVVCVAGATYIFLGHAR